MPIYVNTTRVELQYHEKKNSTTFKKNKVYTFSKEFKTSCDVSSFCLQDLLTSANIAHIVLNVPFNVDYFLLPFLVLF